MWSILPVAAGARGGHLTPCHIFPLLFVFLFSLPSTPASPVSQCEDFGDLDFDLRKTENYDKWFDDNTTMTLAQAGVYVGAEGIAEYVKFALKDSPYVKDANLVTYTGYLREWNAASSECVFAGGIYFDYVINFGLPRFKAAVMVRVDYRPADNKISRLMAYYDTPFLQYFFGALAGSSGAKNFVCGALRGSCTSTWEANGRPSDDECVARLDALPVTTGVFAHVDGNTSGCRLLHAVFADSNPDHCNHISFTPRSDPKGRIKCQTSLNIPHGYGFTDADQFNFDRFKESFGLNITLGYELVEFTGLTVLGKVLIGVGSTLFCACVGGMVYSYFVYKHRMRNGSNHYQDLQPVPKPDTCGVGVTPNPLTNKDDCNPPTQELESQL
eukprot:TRINITY_DN5880_c0_g1_i2.p1 TRINITY_DN5880_c0_g1~~TRINITY_DN5880_c0_g1_i2.p1  ORF type:complete len:385 (+),score=49.41 TRINITY_DN5880_c0_g1_i2:182-1336(+)